jgi:hypothetical protein
MALVDEIQNAHHRFSEVFIGGIPRLLNADGAYLSFICVFSGVEALASYRYPNQRSNGARFQSFVHEYFEPRYGVLAPQLWGLRNSLVHGFGPRHFGLCHHESDRHFTEHAPNIKVLNAEDVYAAFVTAAERYFIHLKSDVSLQEFFERRLNDPDGGSMYVYG